MVEKVDNISDKLSPILLSMHRADVAPLTIIQRKGNAAVANTAVLSIPYLEHLIFYSTLLDAREDIRVTDLAAIPLGMLLVREDDV